MNNQTLSQLTFFVVTETPRPLWAGHAYLEFANREAARSGMTYRAAYSPTADAKAMRYSRIFGSPFNCKHGYGWKLGCPHNCTDPYTKGI